MTPHNPITRIANDLVQVRLPLPFALNHVNVYLLRGASGWTILDTGINWPEAQAVWRSAFQELDIRPRDIEQIVISHLHPDHFGLAGWLQSLAIEDGRTPSVKIGAQENLLFARLWESADPTRFVQYLRLGGVPDSIIDAIAISHRDTLDKTHPRSKERLTIAEGMPIKMGDRLFTPIRTPGHSDGHLMFYDPADRLLLSGDHVLLKITPNIGLWMESQPDPLGRYLQTLSDLQTLEVRIALPGHRGFITDWCGRLQELHAHHLARLERTQEAVARGLHTGYDAAHYIFETERFTHHEWRFAIAETLAHLEYLALRGKLTKSTEEVWMYR